MNLWASGYEKEKLMCLKMSAGGAYGPDYGRSKSLWASGWQQEVFMGLIMAEVRVPGAQDGRSMSLWPEDSRWRWSWPQVRACGS